MRYTFLPLSTLHDAGRVVDDERGYTLRNRISVPFQGIHERLPEPVWWQTNAEGYRSLHGQSYSPKSKKFRIGTFGDSETFGWSVAYENLFQSRMQNADSTVEVLNFGVPGYNVDNIAATVDRVTDSTGLDFVLVLVNPNDLDPPLTFNDLLINSELVRRLIFTYLTLTEESAIESRSDSMAVARLYMGLNRIDRRIREKKIRWAAAFWNSETVSAALRDLQNRSGTALIDVVDVSPVFRRDPKLDFHLSPAGHSELATIFLDRLSHWR